MRDDELRRQLQRRAEATGARDWLARDLPSAVMAAADSAVRPQSLGRSSLQPLAGIATVAALVLVIAVALPPSGASPETDSPSPSAIAVAPVSATERSGDFTLTITATKGIYAPDEALNVEAVLVYDGAEDVVVLSGVFDLIAGFGARQLDGPLAMGPGWDEPCVPHEMRRGEPVRRTYVKSASWSGDDPDGAFYEQWARDPELTFPAGRWELTAIADFAIGSGCQGERVRIDVSITVSVGDLVATATSTPVPTADPAGPSPSPSPTAHAAGAAVRCVQPAGQPPGATPLDLGWTAGVVDDTGLISACVMTAGSTRALRMPVVDWAGRALLIEWFSGGCENVMRLHFSAIANGYALDISETDDRPANVVCDAANVRRAVRLMFDLPLGAPSVAVTLNGRSAAEPPAGGVPCSESDIFLNSGGLGIVEACFVMPPGDYVAGAEPAITNPGGDRRQLEITWNGQDPAICESGMTFELELFERQPEPFTDDWRGLMALYYQTPPAKICFAIFAERRNVVRLLLAQNTAAVDVEFRFLRLPQNDTSPSSVGDFSLAISSGATGPALVYQAEQPIDISATLSYEGPEETVDYSGGAFQVSFWLEQLDGPIFPIRGEPVPCVGHSLRSGEPVTVPFRKQGGWSTDWPLAEWYDRYFADSELRLPAGTYLITATASGDFGDCGAPEGFGLESSIVIKVGP